MEEPRPALEDDVLALRARVEDLRAAAGEERRRLTTLLELHERAPRLTDRALHDFALARAVELTGSEIGFFHLIGDDGRTVHLTTWSGTDRVGCTIPPEEARHYPIDRAGNWVDCVRVGGPVVYNDFAASPNQKGFPLGHAPVRRFMSVPVMEEERVRFIFGVGNKADPYDDADVARLRLVASELHKILRQRLADARLRDREVKLRALFEHSVDAIAMCRGGLVVMANPAFLRLFGYETSAGPIGSPAIERFAPRERMRELEYQMRRAKGEPTPARYETRGLRRDGGEFDLEVHTSLFDLEGAQYTLLILRDATGSRLLEERLRESEKMEAVGRLAGGVAHDFNNLLTAILGNLSHARMELPAEHPALESILEAGKASELAGDLTRRLLSFARREGNDPQATDLSALVARLSTTLARLLEGSGARLELELPEGLERVLVDRGQVERILLNLVKNACDAMPDGGTVRVSTGRVELSAAEAESFPGGAPGDYISLCVADTGVGMTEEVRRRLFEPFFTTKTEGCGTGLGLPIVYGAVRQNRGLIRVDSAPGAGSAFLVLFPRCEGAPHDPPAVAAAEPEHEGRGETVFVVEDDPNVRTVAVRILARFGYRTQGFGDGESALVAARKPGRVDLLLTDIVMPHMDGVTLARLFRDAQPRARVLFVSGYSEEVLDRHGVERRTIDFLAKPFTSRDLAARVRAALDRPA